MKRVVIMHGIPGSGKSTYATELASKYGTLNSEFLGDRMIFKDKDEVYSVIHSTDYFHYVEGVYTFNSTKAKLFHNQNYKNFRDSIDSEIELVIVDNTNVSPFEWEKYSDYGKDCNYSVVHISMPLISLRESLDRNTHNVPEDTIKGMIQRWKRDISF